MTAREYGEELLTRLLVHGTSGIRGAVGAGLVMAEAVPTRQRRQTSQSEEVSPPAVQLRVIAATGSAEILDPHQIGAAAGPLWQGLGDRQVVVDAADALTDLDAAPADVSADLKTVVVTQGDWGGSMPLLFTVYLSEPAPVDVLSEVDELASLLSSAVAVVEYGSGQELKADQMLQMIQYRRVVEQAKGLVMGALSTDGPGAFAVLSRASQHFNVRLRHLAVALVEHVTGAPAERPDDPAAAVEPSAADRAVAMQVWQALRAGSAADAASGSAADGGAAGSGDDAWRG